MDWLLTEDIKNDKSQIYKQCSFIDFAVRTGYKDEPEIDENGQPVTRRTTALHCAARRRFVYGYSVTKLFKIYDRIDVNYTDESGLSHFHAACRFGLDNIVDQFLKLGQNPNLIWHETGDSPLHLALTNANKEVVELLLRNGADPNSTNKDGSTPLHIICKIESSNMDDRADLFFKIVDEQHLPVQIDTRDKLDRTSLQWAVASILPNVVDLLLDRGADLTCFVFPTESYYGEMYGPLNEHYDEFAISLAANALITLECLEKRGYELNRSDTLRIMKFIDKFGALFDMPTDFSERGYKSKKFAKEAKKLMVSSSLSLYKVVQLSVEEVVKLILRTTLSSRTRIIIGTCLKCPVEHVLLTLSKLY
ncbi:hypothetical protein TKK_0010518 [Trichogramma kaykai]